jgi:hypothetical protein
MRNKRSVNNAPYRSGISMLEVLISIGVVAIGLVSIAALIPVGGVQVQKSNTQERTATLGLNAFREFQVRGMDTIPTLPDPSTLTSAQTTAIQNQGPWICADGSPFFTVVSTPSGSIWNPATRPPLAIDPLMVAVGGSAVDSFPANSPVGPPLLKRLSLTSVYNITPNAYRSLANAVFTAADDVINQLPDDASQAGSTALDANNIKRDSNGEFTWLATLAPTYADTASLNPAQMNQFTLSIVVFDRRVLTTPTPATEDQGQEEIVLATSATPIVVSTNGGEFTLSDDASTHPNASGKLSMVRPDQWIMLTRYLPVAANSPPLVEAKWFRVATVGNITQSGTILSRQVTLAGADWEPDPTAASTANPLAPYIAPTSITWGGVPAAFQNYNTYACLFDGAVGVYQKVIHLEGPSVWNQ